MAPRIDSGGHPMSVVVAGGQRAGTAVAQLWSGPALVGLVHQEDDGIVVRLGAHARGPVVVSATALEHALAEARERLASAPRPTHATTDSHGRDRGDAARRSSHVLP
jgi:hypothetical protein